MQDEIDMVSYNVIIALFLIYYQILMPNLKDHDTE